VAAESVGTDFYKQINSKPPPMKKIAALLFISLLAALSSRADVLFQDSTNYPYSNGCIEGQGQWYCFYPSTPYRDAMVTNNVLFLNTTNHDEVAAPTNGFSVSNPGTITYASFAINVSQLPSSAGYFCQFQNNNDTNDVCHIFISTRDTVVPGTYRLGIANFDTSFSTVVPPVNFPMDLAPGVTYNVVIAYDTDPESLLTGGTLMINPSYQDYLHLMNDSDNGTTTYFGISYVYPNDTTSSQGALDIGISQIGFSPYANAGISNVMAGTDFTDVNNAYPPAIGIQPQSGTNYSGNSAAFYTAASGVDLTYQWYDSNGPLTDGVNIIGSRSNILVINNLSTSDNYYVVVSDAYAATATSATATNTVITTPTAPFFTDAPLNLTNNLFTPFGLTNIAKGTGPLTYQWNFAPTNSPNTFTALSGQTAPGLNITELEYPNAGNYYVQATGPDGVTAGPTNNLVVVAPLVATLPQLHTFMGLVVSSITGANTIPINTNGLSVSGYVTTFGPLTASTKTYSEFYIGYEGYGIYVYYASAGTNAAPPPGTYVTVTGPCQVYNGQLEIDPGTNNGVVISSNTPIQMPAPTMGNFAQFATNALGAYGVQAQCSLVTFTNIYIYGTKTGGAYTGGGGNFYTNGYTALYITQGPYSNPGNTNVFELYVPAYGYGSISTNLWGQKVPSHAYQLTGVMANYKGTSELDLTRLQDIVTNALAPFMASVAQTKGVTTISWPVQAGSTYSVNSTTNLKGPWTNQTFGLSYYPTNGTFTDPNAAQAKFYKISTP
jgi:hypothetical protein